MLTPQLSEPPAWGTSDEVVSSGPPLPGWSEELSSPPPQATTTRPARASAANARRKEWERIATSIGCLRRAVSGLRRDVGEICLAGCKFPTGALDEANRGQARALRGRYVLHPSGSSGPWGEGAGGGRRQR